MRSSGQEHYGFRCVPHLIRRREVSVGQADVAVSKAMRSSLTFDTDEYLPPCRPAINLPLDQLTTRSGPLKK